MPPEPPPAAIQHRVELLISRWLSWGVAASLILLTCGIVLSFLQDSHFGRALPAAPPAGQVAKQAAEPVAPALQNPTLPNAPSAHRFPPPSFAQMATGLAHGNGSAFIYAGLLLLIATPALRVAISLVAFAVERDRAYVLITGAVLLLLAISVLLGLWSSYSGVRQ